MRNTGYLIFLSTSNILYRYKKKNKHPVVYSGYFKTNKATLHKYNYDIPHIKLHKSYSAIYFLIIFCYCYQILGPKRVSCFLIKLCIITAVISYVSDCLNYGISVSFFFV